MLNMPTNKGFVVFKKATRTLKNGKVVPFTEDFYTKSKSEAELMKKKFEQEGFESEICECIF